MEIRGKKGGQQRESHKRRPSQRLKKLVPVLYCTFLMKHILKRVTVSARRVAPITQAQACVGGPARAALSVTEKVGHLVNRIDSPVIDRKKEACPVQAPCSTLPDSGCLRRRLITLQAGRAHCGRAASMDVLLN